MDAKDPSSIIEEQNKQQNLKSNIAQNVLEWFLAKETNELYLRNDVIKRLSNKLDTSTENVDKALSYTVSDIVDPVQQITVNQDQYVGVIEYKEYPEKGAYGYVHFDDVKGKNKRVVCAQCVKEANSDTEITHATESMGTADANTTWSRLLDKIVEHYANSHDTVPDNITPGASLLSGTTIAGNRSVHVGAETFIDIRQQVNTLFIQNARQDFELGLSILSMNNGQFETYATNSKIAISSNVNINFGSPVNNNGTVQLDSISTKGFTQHIQQDYDILPKEIVVSDDLETNPSNGTVEYELEDENGNIVNIPRNQLNTRIDVSSTIETYGVKTRAILTRNSTSDTSPVLDAYSVYVGGNTPDDYIDATLTNVSET